MGVRRVLTMFVVALVAVAVYKKIDKTFYEIPPLPVLNDTWWGDGDPAKEDKKVHPYKILVTDRGINSLNERLGNTTLYQEPLEGAAHHYGINTNLLKDIVEFWRTEYNWGARSRFLNQYDQFTVYVQGLKIFFVHVKPKKTYGLKVLPLLMLHGWPGSFREFYEIIPFLTTPQEGRDFIFELIIPSLPGYGVSDAAVRPGLGAAQVAVVMKNLMNKVGFQRYYVQGGDWGAIIATHMAKLFPKQVIGVHCNMCFVNTPLANLKTFIGSYFPSLVVDKENEHKMYPLSKKFDFLVLETGYMHIQSTKPDTIGVALRDSPVGLAAYILEKFIAWTNPEYKNLEDGGLEKKYTWTKVLDNVMIYWFTRSITTSMRLYAETFNKEQLALNLERIPVEVPSGCARFTYEVAYQPDSLLREKYTNLVHSADYEGGHFAALEVPKVLADDIYTFIEKVQNLRQANEPREAKRKANAA